jgi:hypothetical protein
MGAAGDRLRRFFLAFLFVGLRASMKDRSTKSILNDSDALSATRRVRCANCKISNVGFANVVDRPCDDTRTRASQHLLSGAPIT